jgi:hypothetical protein
MIRMNWQLLAEQTAGPDPAQIFIDGFTFLRSVRRSALRANDFLGRGSADFVNELPIAWRWHQRRRATPF